MLVLAVCCRGVNPALQGLKLGAAVHEGRVALERELIPHMAKCDRMFDVVAQLQARSEAAEQGGHLTVQVPDNTKEGVDVASLDQGPLPAHTEKQLENWMSSRMKHFARRAKTQGVNKLRQTLASMVRGELGMRFNLWSVRLRQEQDFELVHAAATMEKKLTQRTKYQAVQKLGLIWGRMMRGNECTKLRTWTVKMRSAKDSTEPYPHSYLALVTSPTPRMPCSTSLTLALTQGCTAAGGRYNGPKAGKALQVQGREKAAADNDPVDARRAGDKV